MPNLPDFRNPYTGELLANAVEVCPACHRNFASTRAGDLHRATVGERRVCLDPYLIGLELTVNRHGALIFRKPRNGVGAGIRAENLSPEGNQVQELALTA
jgi:hypothetical protein